MEYGPALLLKIILRISKGKGGHHGKSPGGRKEKVGQKRNMTFKKPGNNNRGGSNENIYFFHI